MPRARRFLSRLIGESVKLDASTTQKLATGEGEETSWIQVARVGSWAGHSAGPFQFTTKVFDDLIRNLRAHPSFQLGPDGYGCADVVPFDFHHASERPASEVAVTGAPAQAWGQDLEMRTGADGVVQLWCKTRFLPLAKGYAKGDQYKWTSVAVWPNAPDPVTGKDVGWYMSSIAFTNDPFIQGMEPIAATRASVAAQALRLGYYLDPYNPAKTADDVVCALREMLGLDKLADLATLFAELAKLKQYATVPGSAPPGVELAELVGELRVLFNLPTLTPTSRVFEELDSLLEALAESAASPVTADRKDPTDMSLLRNFLLGRLALATTTTDEQVLEATRLKLEQGSDALAKLKAFAELFGAANPDEAAAMAVEKIAQAKSLTEKVAEMMPEMESLKAKVGETENAKAEADVDEVMASKRIAAEHRDVLLAYRKSQPEAFAKKYPPLTPEERKLLTSVVTTRNGSGSGSAPGGTLLSAERMGAGSTPEGFGQFGSATAEEIGKMPGETIEEKAINLAKKRAKDEGRELSHQQAHAAGIALARAAKNIERRATI